MVSFVSFGIPFWVIIPVVLIVIGVGWKLVKLFWAAISN